MYYREKCKLCGKCLAACQNNHYDSKTAIKEMIALREGRFSDILTRCVTCYACNEVCEEGANPFDLICEMQEKTAAIKVSESVRQRWNPTEKMPNNIKKGKPGRPAISLCTIGPRLPWPFEGPIFDDLTHISGGDYQCQSAWMHYGMKSRIRENLGSFIENLAATGEKEIIFPHPGCYNSVTNLAMEFEFEVPFRAVHIFAYLFEHLKHRKNEIQLLNMKIAYHRPCAARLSPEMDVVLDDLFNLIGVERVARTYDYKKTLCCGLPLVSRDEARIHALIEKNLEDAKNSNAEAMVFSCTGCFRFLSTGAIKRGMNVYMVNDLCRVAIGEELKNPNMLSPVTL